MSTPIDRTQEIEIKLDLGSFTNYLKLIGFLGQLEAGNNHLNAFFDTKSRALAAAGWALRVRVENKRGLITIKNLATEKGAAFIRQEIEAEIDRATAREIISGNSDLSLINLLPVNHIRDIIKNDKLTKLVTFENNRQKKLFKIGDYSYVFEIDKTEYSDGSIDYELELELNNLSRLEVVQDRLEKLFTSLDIPFVIQKKSKFTRALQHGGIQ